MIKELDSSLSMVEMQLAREDISLDQAYQLVAVAITKIPGEIRAKYLRDQHVSTVHADVHVDAVGIAPLELHAIVGVELTCKGDMVRSSEQTREEINNRLQDLAQQHCAKIVHKEIVETSKVAPRIRKLHQHQVLFF
jgi:hypothetical protein